jgi:predicted amidophosphoribosyltransferase
MRARARARTADVLARRRASRRRASAGTAPPGVRGAVVATGALTGGSFALVDDVMTTGATLAEAAATLRRAGAARVDGWVVARTVPPALS